MSSGTKRGKWTCGEDAQLRAAVLDHKGKNWKNIARAAFGDAKSDVQCLHRSLDLHHRPPLLPPSTADVPPPGVCPARALPLRWQKVLDPKLVKGPWTKEEDLKVMALVDQHGPKKWSTIAASLPGRIGKQCRERWHNHLNPHIRKDAWTTEEDSIILNAHHTIGNKCHPKHTLPHTHLSYTHARPLS